jgi:hypothetical protein
MRNDNMTTTSEWNGLRRDTVATRFDVKDGLGGDIRSKSTVRVISYSGIPIICLANGT